MRVSCEKRIFEEAVQIVSRGINARSPLPILGHILLEAGEESITMTATDLDLGLEMRVAAEVHEPGALTCPAKLLQEIVSKLPAGPVSLNLEREGQLKLSCGHTQFELSTLPAEEFPSMPESENAPVFSLPQAVLKTMIRQVGVAAASPNDESRAVMTGILTRLEPTLLTMVATDGRRLSCMRHPLEEDAERVAEVIVPARAMQEMVRLLGEEDEGVMVKVTEGQVFFTVGAVSLHCRLLEGNFPDYRKVVPTEFQRTCRLGREAFLNGLRRMLIVAQEKRSPHLIRLRFAQDALTLSANTPDLGSGSEQIDVVYEGEELLIAFNGRYLVDVLNVLECEEVQFDLQEETRSAVVRPFGSNEYDYVVMPVKLREPAPDEVDRVPVGA